MPGRHTPGTAQKADLITDRGTESVLPEGRRPGRGDLDRQGHPVEAVTEARDDCAVELKVGVARPGAVEEEAYAVGLGGKRAELHHPLVGYAEPLAGGGEHREMRALVEQGADECADVVDEVLAVVQDEKEPARPQMARDRAAQLLGRQFGHAEHIRHSFRDEAGPHGHEVHERTARGKPSLGLRCDHGRQAGLAHPAGPDHAHQAVVVEGAKNCVAVCLAPDEGASPAGKPDNEPGPAARHGLLRAGERGQFPPVGRAELAQQRRDVVLHGPDGDVQGIRDLGVRLACGQLGQDLRLPIRDERRRRLVHADKKSTFPPG